jgi:hypothetical protein
MKKGIITQSNYIPWKGYFDSIKNVDIFIVYDDMQYTKRDWRNRNMIKTPQGLKWLTIPVEVRGKFFQKIKDTKVADNTWNKQHWEIIKTNYKKAKCYNETSEWLESLFMQCNFQYLTEINMHFINGINEFLNIDIDIRFSSEFDLAEEKTDKLVSICKQAGIIEYYSGPAAKAYMDESKFLSENIQVKYWDYSGYPIYSQTYEDFEHGVSIIDLILNEGYNSINFLKANIL